MCHEKNINAMKGNIQNTKIDHLIVNDNKTVTDDKNSEILANQYYYVSSNNNINPNFLANDQIRKEKLENLEKGSRDAHLHNDPLPYNNDITLKELQKQLNKRKQSSAPGADSITYKYKMVNETPIKFKYHILKFFNNIWLAKWQITKNI